MLEKNVERKRIIIAVDIYFQSENWTMSNVSVIKNKMIY